MHAYIHRHRCRQKRKRGRKEGGKRVGRGCGERKRDDAHAYVYIRTSPRDAQKPAARACAYITCVCTFESIYTRNEVKGETHITRAELLSFSLSLSLVIKMMRKRGGTRAEGQVCRTRERYMYIYAGGSGRETQRA